jgi:hypothetical protein
VLYDIVKANLAALNPQEEEEQPAEVEAPPWVPALPAPEGGAAADNAAEVQQEGRQEGQQEGQEGGQEGGQAAAGGEAAGQEALVQEERDAGAGYHEGRYDDDNDDDQYDQYN